MDSRGFVASDSSSFGDSSTAGSSYSEESTAELVRDQEADIIDGIMSGEIDTVEKLREYEDINFDFHADTTGITILHAAVQVGNVELTKHLIKEGTDVNVLDESGNSPLASLIELRFKKIQHGSIDEYAYSAIKGRKDYQEGETESVMRDYNASKEEYRENFRIVKLLVEAGTDLSKKNALGKNVFDLANENFTKKDKKAFVLITHAAKSNSRPDTRGLEQQAPSVPARRTDPGPAQVAHESKQKSKPAPPVPPRASGGSVQEGTKVEKPATERTKPTRP